MPQFMRHSSYSTRAHFRRWSFVVMLLAVLCPGVLAAQSQTPTFDEYLALLGTAATAAERNDRAALEEAARVLGSTSGVRLTDGAVSPVDNRWLDRALRAPEPDLAAIAARLNAVVDALTQPESSAPADARERLAHILNNPPFNEQTDESPNWWRNFLNWLGRLFDQLARPAAAGGETFVWIVGTLGVVLLAGVIVYLLLGLRRTLVAEGRAIDDDPEANLTAQSALDQAAVLAREGDRRTAARYLYLSALLWLDEHDMLRYDRALTNREYLDRVGGNPILRGQLTPIVDTFDRVWYGHVPLDDAAFAAYRSQVEALRMSVRSQEPGNKGTRKQGDEETR